MSHQVTARVSDDLHKQIVAVSDEINGTKAEAMRTLMERGLEINKIERENQQLRDQLAATNQRIDANNELVEYVEEELSYREAGLLTRSKWWLLGKKTDR